MGEEGFNVNDVVLMSDKGKKTSVCSVKFNESNINQDNHTPIFYIHEKTYSLKFSITPETGTKLEEIFRISNKEKAILNKIRRKYIKRLKKKLPPHRLKESLKITGE